MRPVTEFKPRNFSKNCQLPVMEFTDKTMRGKIEIHLKKDPVGGLYLPKVSSDFRQSLPGCWSLPHRGCVTHQTTKEVTGVLVWSSDSLGWVADVAGDFGRHNEPPGI